MRSPENAGIPGGTRVGNRKTAETGSLHPGLAVGLLDNLRRDHYGMQR